MIAPTGDAAEALAGSQRSAGSLAPSGARYVDESVARGRSEGQGLGPEPQDGGNEGRGLEGLPGRRQDDEQSEHDHQPRRQPEPATSSSLRGRVGAGQSRRSGLTVMTSATRPSHSSRGASQYSSISFPSGSTVYRLLLTP